ncbi:Ferric enterobactin transport system permease protein FepG [Frondihabitans sp. 762G35]|uniref:FecCD family ABC transporter permease n=1 Tax=Frondihabitans sp. 762G35 TaxID=1446794 RepID=UPI000D2198A5|nr:iron chelate uptake ABC transporter family permease subunit [Frondihabitans sp. 762G35]ARC57224.1 Ferric enterobactin transport system permease protein FepG [Frondihabitans sp. 762G35]
MTAPVTRPARSLPAAPPAPSRPVLRLGSWLSLPLRRRLIVVGSVALLGLLVLSLLTLALGSLGVPLPDLARAVLGDSDARTQFVLNVYRGPRLVTAIGAGAALGVSGALFQTVTRNPLGSPDVIGLGAGASAGAATFGLLLPGILPTPVGALVGALVAIGLVYLGTGRGFSSPGRMILVGIGVSAMATAFVQFVLTRVQLQEATALAAYLSGTLADRSWGDASVVWVAVVVLVPCAVALGRRLDLVEMGDDVADALGARSTATRTLVVLTAIGLSTAAVASAGPIAFVALTAPQVARRLARAPGASIVLSGLVGALLMVLADFVVQRGVFGSQLPVGLLTALLGGVYLGYLLLREWKKGTL